MNTIYTFISTHKAEIQQVNLGKTKAFVEIGVRQYPFILPDNKAREKLAAFAAQHKVKVFDTLAKAPASPKAAPKPAPRSQDSHMTTNNEPWPSQTHSRAPEKPAPIPQVSEKPAMVLMPSAKNALARHFEAVFGTKPEEWEMRYLVWAIEYAKPVGGKLATVIARWASGQEPKPAPKAEPKPVEAAKPLKKSKNALDTVAWNWAMDSATADNGNIAPSEDQQKEARSYLAGKRKNVTSLPAMLLTTAYNRAVQHPISGKGEVGGN